MNEAEHVQHELVFVADDENTGESEVNVEIQRCV